MGPEAQTLHVTVMILFFSWSATFYFLKLITGDASLFPIIVLAAYQCRVHFKKTLADISLSFLLVGIGHDARGKHAHTWQNTQCQLPEAGDLDSIQLFNIKQFIAAVKIMLACQELLFFPTALTLYPGMPLAGWE